MHLIRKIWNPVFATIDLKNATLTIQDGTGTPESIEVTIGEGNLTYTENRAIDYILDRGNLDDVREGDQAPVDVSFDFQWDYISSLSLSGTPTVEDALKAINEASTWVSVDTDACRPYAVDLIVLYTPTPTTCGDKETITFSDFRYETLEHDLREGTISCTGRCNVTTVTALREAQV